MAIYSGFSHKKWWFSIVMFVYQRVMTLKVHTWLAGKLMTLLQPSPWPILSRRQQKRGKIVAYPQWKIGPLDFMVRFYGYPLVNQRNYGKSLFFMGKSTISMAIFNSFLYVYQRVTPWYPCNPKTWSWDDWGGTPMTYCGWASEILHHQKDGWNPII